MKSGEALALSPCSTACNWLRLWIFRYLFVASGVAEGLQIRATVCCHVSRTGCRLAMGCTLSKAALTEALALRTSLQSSRSIFTSQPGGELHIAMPAMFLWQADGLGCVAFSYPVSPYSMPVLAGYQG